MAGVLPSGLPTISNVLTDLDMTTDLLLAYDSAAEQLKSFPCGQVLDYIPVNTVYVNTIDDLPAASGGFITLLDNTEYIINAIINIGNNSLLMGSGTTIQGWNAGICQIVSTSGAPVISTSGVSGTCVVKGPLRIKSSTAGELVSVDQNVFFISEGVLYDHTGSSGFTSIYVSTTGCRGLFLDRMTSLSAGCSLFCEGNMTFGCTISNYNSTTTTGNAFYFTNNLTTNIGTIVFTDCNSISGGAGIYCTAGSSSINISNSRFESTGNHCLWIDNSTGYRIGSLNISNSSFTVTSAAASKHAVKIDGAYFDSVSITGGLIKSEATGASYGLKGTAYVASPEPFSSGLSVLGTRISGTTASLNGVSKGDLKVSFKNCFGVADSVTSGTLYVSAGTGTFAVPFSTPGEVYSPSLNGVDTSGNLERTSTNVSDTSYRLKVTSTNSGTGTAHYTACFTQSDATSRTYTLQLHSSVSGLVPGSETKVTLKSSSEPAAVSISVPIQYTTNEEYFFKMASTNAHTVTFQTLTLSIGT